MLRTVCLPGVVAVAVFGLQGRVAHAQPRGDDYTSVNLTITSQIKPFVLGASTANDCWGYVSPSGREYALYGLSTGTAFVEVTDPNNLVVVDTQNGPISTWRDMKTYQHYAYAVSEGGGGIQIFDLADIDSGFVSFLGNVFGNGTGDTHNVAINEVSGYLYRSGGGNEGLRIYDLNSNPASPSFVGEWDDRYLHDVQVVTYTDGPYADREIAFGCGGTEGGFSDTGLYIVDVTDKGNPIQVSYYRYPGAEYAHQGWLSDDKSLFYLNDEFDEGEYQIHTHTHIIDVRDIENPREVSVFSSGTLATDHNLFTLDRYLYLCNYTEGLRVFDITDPLHPVQIAFSDTYPNSSGNGYDGLWGNYPYFPSGTVVGTDQENGLFVWDISDMSDCNGNGIDDGIDMQDGLLEDLDSNRIPDSCQTVLHVPEDYATLQEAIDAAGFGDMILVADGTYTGPLNRDLFFGGKVVSLLSENGPESCIIDLESAGRLANFETGESFGTIINGFTIRNGFADQGAAIRADGASATIINCILENNEATSFGGAIYWSNSHLFATNCIFRNNVSSDGGALFFDDGVAVVRNSLIAGNSSSLGGGGGVHIRGTYGPMIENCTIVHNHGATNGGGLYVVGGDPTFSNCVIWDNDAPDDPNVYLLNVELDIRYSDVEGGWEGDGNLDADPLFVDIDGPDNNVETVEDNDYHLTKSSPCINAGDPDYEETPAEDDLDHQPRISEIIDMGADEYYPGPCPADVNGDDLVDPLDSGFVLARFGCPVGTGDEDCDLADANEDGAVDPLDAGFVQARFGECP